MHNDASDAERTGSSRLAGSKVLVAEATAVIALDLERTLRGFDCGVLGPVGSVAEALLLLERERPDAALLELDLSDGHAAPLAETLASLGVPFALATAHDRSDQDEPVLRGVPRVMKPYESGQLYRTLIHLLGPAPETLEPVQGSAGRSSDHGHPGEDPGHAG
jgi:two-component SAPR family response regulator